MIDKIKSKKILLPKLKSKSLIKKLKSTNKSIIHFDLQQNYTIKRDNNLLLNKVHLISTRTNVYDRMDASVSKELLKHKEMVGKCNQKKRKDLSLSNMEFFNRLVNKNSHIDKGKFENDFFSHVNYSENLRRVSPEKKIKKVGSMTLTNPETLRKYSSMIHVILNKNRLI